MNSSLISACKERGRYTHISRGLKTVKQTIGGLTFKHVIIDPRPGTTYRAPRDNLGEKIKADGRTSRAPHSSVGMRGRYMPHQGERECARRMPFRGWAKCNG